MYSKTCAVLFKRELSHYWRDNKYKHIRTASFCVNGEIETAFQFTYMAFAIDGHGLSNEAHR